MQTMNVYIMTREMFWDHSESIATITRLTITQNLPAVLKVATTSNYVNTVLNHQLL